MSDRKLTLLELHFQDGLQLGPKTIGLGGDERADEDEDEAETGLLELGADETVEDADEDADEASADDGGSPVALLVGLVVLATVAAVIRRLLGDDAADTDDAVEIETPDEDVEEFESAN